jgi:hypothetical protein
MRRVLAPTGVPTALSLTWSRSRDYLLLEEGKQRHASSAGLDGIGHLSSNEQGHARLWKAKAA